MSQSFNLWWQKTGSRSRTEASYCSRCRWGCRFSVLASFPSWRRPGAMMLDHPPDTRWIPLHGFSGPSSFHSQLHDGMGWDAGSSLPRRLRNTGLSFSSSCRSPGNIPRSSDRLFAEASPRPCDGIVQCPSSRTVFQSVPVSSD